MNDGNVMRHLRNDNGNSWVCPFCANPFPREVQPETFRHHLSRICESAPEDVKESAQRWEVEAAECSRSVNIDMNDGNVMKYLQNNNDISWVCQFCGHPFRWEVQPQTFRHHLTMICKSVEDDVREAAAWFFEAECSRYGGSRTASTSAASNSVAQAGKEAEAETEGSRYDQGAEVQPERFRHHLTRMCESAPEDVKESAQRREVEAEECSSVEVNWEPTRILDAPENNDSNFEAEAKVASVKRTRREGSVQSGNKRHRSMPNTLPIAPEVEVLEGIQETGESASLTNRPVGDAFGRNVEKKLISNDIEVIPSGHTPRCPNLSTLLCRNLGLRMMRADSFFEQFQRLKVLDLSGCGCIEELPRSISNLVNLTALLLRECESLIHVPSLAKLEKLKKLDLNGCMELEEMPESVRFLLNLKYLDLSGSGIEEIGSGILPTLSRLQVLKLCDENGHSKFSIRGSEVGELRILETLHCRFSNVREFGEYMKSRERSQQSPSDYSIFIGWENSFWPSEGKLGSRKFVSVTGYSFIDCMALPTDIEALNIRSCDSTMNEGFPFSNYSTHSLSNHSLLNLKLISIWQCHELKKLFPPSLLPNLHNLQMISVGCCYGMEEIFSTDQEEEDGQELLFDQPNLAGLHLSRLTTLKLRYLPELRSIYKGAIICHSLQQIQLLNCPKLKRITLPLPQPSLQRIQVYPKELWESLHWGGANDKSHLESLCIFNEY